MVAEEVVVVAGVRVGGRFYDDDGGVVMGMD